MMMALGVALAFVYIVGWVVFLAKIVLADGVKEEIVWGILCLIYELIPFAVAKVL